MVSELSFPCEWHVCADCTVRWEQNTRAGHSTCKPNPHTSAGVPWRPPHRSALTTQCSIGAGQQGTTTPQHTHPHTPCANNALVRATDGVVATCGAASYHALYQHPPSVKTTRGVGSAKNWDFGVVLARARGGEGGRVAVEGKAPERRPQQRLDRRLGAASKAVWAVTVGYKCH